jgi:hypothetical protein
MRVEAEAYLAAVAARPDVAAVKRRHVVIAGPVGQTPLAAVERLAVDLLIMVTRSRRKLARWAARQIT